MPRPPPVTTSTGGEETCSAIDHPVTTRHEAGRETLERQDVVRLDEPALTQCDRISGALNLAAVHHVLVGERDAVARLCHRADLGLVQRGDEHVERALRRRRAPGRAALKYLDLRVA